MLITISIHNCCKKRNGKEKGREVDLEIKRNKAVGDNIFIIKLLVNLLLLTQYFDKLKKIIP